MIHRKNRAVLLLNADYTPLSFVSIKRALKMYFSGKINIVKEVENTKVHPSLDIGMPNIIALKSYVYLPYNKTKIFPTRKRILSRDQNECQYCSKKLNKDTATIDHVIPKSHKNYPGHIWTNVVACCKKCNNKKDDKTPDEASMPLRSQPFVPKAEDLIVHNQKTLREIMEELKEMTT